MQSRSLPLPQLVAAARSGDRAAIEELFARLLPRVRQIAALRMGCRETELWESEDLVQETLLDAFRALERFEVKSEGALCSWLATLVKNNLTDHARHRRAGRRDARRVLRPKREDTSLLTDSVLGTDSNTPSRYAQATEMESRLETALLALDERQRRVIELRKLCELSFEDIATELGFTSASSARSLFSRAMGRLAEAL